MKRAIRVIVLTPIYVVALTAMWIVSPFVAFLRWLFDDGDTFSLLWEMTTDAGKEIWG